MRDAAFWTLAPVMSKMSKMELGEIDFDRARDGW